MKRGQTAVNISEANETSQKFGIIKTLEITAVLFYIADFVGFHEHFSEQTWEPDIILMQIVPFKNVISLDSCVSVTSESGFQQEWRFV